MAGASRDCCQSTPHALFFFLGVGGCKGGCFAKVQAGCPNPSGSSLNGGQARATDIRTKPKNQRRSPTTSGQSVPMGHSASNYFQLNISRKDFSKAFKLWGR